MDYDMLEEDQMMRAIAMSLGQDITNTAAEDQVQQYPANTDGFPAFVSWDEKKKKQNSKMCS